MFPDFLDLCSVGKDLGMVLCGRMHKERGRPLTRMVYYD